MQRAWVTDQSYRTSHFAFWDKPGPPAIWSFGFVARSQIPLFRAQSSSSSISPRFAYTCLLSAPINLSIDSPATPCCDPSLTQLPACQWPPWLIYLYLLVRFIQWLEAPCECKWVFHNVAEESCFQGTREHGVWTWCLPCLTLSSASCPTESQHHTNPDRKSIFVETQDRILRETIFFEVNIQTTLKEVNITETRTSRSWPAQVGGEFNSPVSYITWKAWRKHLTCQVQFRKSSSSSNILWAVP